MIFKRILYWKKEYVNFNDVWFIWFDWYFHFEHEQIKKIKQLINCRYEYICIVSAYASDNILYLIWIEINFTEYDNI